MKLLKQTLLVEKKSKFYGYLYSIEKEVELKEILSKVKSENQKARHIVWAARMTTPFYEKMTDDGEPSGTAGRPILSVMQKKGLDNLAIIVVRYFGGVKLGTGGLCRAYSSVAATLLKEEK